MANRPQGIRKAAQKGVIIATIKDATIFGPSHQDIDASPIKSDRSYQVEFDSAEFDEIFTDEGTRNKLDYELMVHYDFLA